MENKENKVGSELNDEELKNVSGGFKETINKWACIISCQYKGQVCVLSTMKCREKYNWEK